MKKITKKQTMTLLRKAQRFQCLDCGVHKICITTYFDEGKTWFTINGYDNYGKMQYCGCYDWRTYDENKVIIDEFLEKFN